MEARILRRREQRLAAGIMSRARSLSHLDGHGEATMVDVGAKKVSRRSAEARALIRLPAVCSGIIAAGGDTKKGNVLQVARLAGIMAAKRTADLIPLCHQIPLDVVRVTFTSHARHIEVRAEVRCRGRTGVEMEALSAVAVAALTIYDMLKASSHDLVIERMELVRKSGGRRGRIMRKVPSPDQH